MADTKFQLLQQRLAVARTMTMHICLVFSISLKWRILSKAWSDRCSHKANLTTLAEHVMAIDPRRLADPFVGRNMTRKHQIDLLDDVAAGGRILRQMDTNLVRLMRRMYVLLNLAVPVDMTGYSPSYT